MKASLQFDEIVALGDQNRSFQLNEMEWERIRTSTEHLARILASGAPIYGIHTGFGSDVVSPRQLKDHSKNQKELLDYLTVGVGKPFSHTVTRRALRLQLHKVAKGHSGVSIAVAQKLESLCNSARLPDVPSFGSLGASGDLIPMAHAISRMMSEVPEELWGPRDALGLVNTNSFMAAYAAELFQKATSIFNQTTKVTAFVSVGLGTSEEPFSAEGLGINSESKDVIDAGERILQHRSQFLTQVSFGKSLKAPALRSKDFPLQERYSVRCAPQILGNASSLLQEAQKKIVLEANLVADNPLILPEKAWHGGHFYTAALATACDHCLEVVARCTELMDRQILLLMHPNTNHGLPENLAAPGASHTKGLHQLISSLQQQVRSLSLPSRLMSFSAEGNNQDVLPCTMAALHNLNASLELAVSLGSAAEFVSERAALMRHQSDLPKRLYLDHWKKKETAF